MFTKVVYHKIFVTVQLVPVLSPHQASCQLQTSNSLSYHFAVCTVASDWLITLLDQWADCLIGALHQTGYPGHRLFVLRLQRVNISSEHIPPLNFSA